MKILLITEDHFHEMTNSEYVWVSDYNMDNMYEFTPIFGKTKILGNNGNVYVVSSKDNTFYNLKFIENDQHLREMAKNKKEDSFEDNEENYWLAAEAIIDQDLNPKNDKEYVLIDIVYV